ncbi:MAG: hypothetical protein HKN36_08850 [Hellea sp.]|nr:hypothetical protein [Hellea sp.]
MIIRKTLMTLAAASMMVPALASAGETAPQAGAFTVKTTTDYRVKEAVKSFKSGDFTRSIAYSQKAIEEGLSTKREAIAFSNLCAALAASGDMNAATEACDTALELRPDYAPAVDNKAALTVMLAQK